MSQLKNTMRIALAGAIVCGIGWTYLTLNPAATTKTQIEVKPAKSVLATDARADIYGISFADNSNTQKFVEALDNMGHEPPRAYDFNGNKTYFSTRQTRRTPKELVQDYQQEFVKQRVNKRINTMTVGQMLYMSQDGAKQQVQQMLSRAMHGEIIPHAITKDHMSMGGALMQLPEDDYKVDLTTTSITDAQKLQSAYDVYLHAYNKCGGDQAIHKAALAKDLSGEEVMAKMAKDIKGVAKTPKGKCTGGGVCTEEQNDFDQISAKSAALQSAIKKQPKLQNCRLMKRAQLALAAETMEDGQKRIKALRYIEAFRDPDTGITNVTATWTGENFKAKNMMVDKYGYPKKSKIRGDLPLCPDCTRTWNFGGTGHERPFTQDMLISNKDINKTSDFYANAMAKKGWKMVDSDRKALDIMKTDKVQSNTRFLRFARGGKHMTLRIRNNASSKKTEIFSTRSD